jgi:hypothetical protein
MLIIDRSWYVWFRGFGESLVIGHSLLAQCNAMEPMPTAVRRRANLHKDAVQQNRGQGSGVRGQGSGIGEHGRHW